jgi:peptide deformylase
MRFLITVIVLATLTGCAGAPVIETNVQELQMKSSKVNNFTARDNENIEKLKRLMNDYDLLAISPPVIGSKRRYIIIRDNESYTLMLNPEIIANTGQKNDIETSLVVPGIKAIVTRSENITVLYQDVDKKEQELKASGSLARQIQQQLDLLNGVLIFDVAKSVYGGE